MTLPAIALKPSLLDHRKTRVRLIRIPVCTARVPRSRDTTCRTARRDAPWSRTYKSDDPLNTPPSVALIDELNVGIASRFSGPGPRSYAFAPWGVAVCSSAWFLGSAHAARPADKRPTRGYRGVSSLDRRARSRLSHHSRAALLGRSRLACAFMLPGARHRRGGCAPESTGSSACGCLQRPTLCSPCR